MVKVTRPVHFQSTLVINNDNIDCLCPAEKPVHSSDEGEDRAPYKMIQTIGLSVGAAVAYIIVVLGLMFYCKKRRNAKRMEKGQDGEEPEMECLNGTTVRFRRT